MKYLFSIFIAVSVYFSLSDQLLAACSDGIKSTNFEIIGKEADGYRMRVTTQNLDAAGNPTGPVTTNEIVENDYFLISNLVVDQILSDPEITDEELARYKAIIKEIVPGYVDYYNNTIQPAITSMIEGAQGQEELHNRLREGEATLVVGPIRVLSQVADAARGGLYDQPGFNQERLKRFAQQLKAEFTRTDETYRDYFGKGHGYESAIADNPGERVDAFSILASGECNRVALNTDSMRFIAAEGQGTGTPETTTASGSQET